MLMQRRQRGEDDTMPQINFRIESNQGPLPKDFHINLEGSYIALVGANNAAKSSILQAIFKKFWNQQNAKNKCETCLILPERIFVHPTTETGGNTLEWYNGQLQGTIGANSANRSYAGLQGPSSSDLPKFLLNHWSFGNASGLLATQTNRLRATSSVWSRAKKRRSRCC